MWRLRYRHRGWNGAAADPVRDVAWALDQMRARHPGASAVLVGHSMGGRAALWAAGDQSVVGVCALAPWVELGDPVEQLADRHVLIAHGDRDRITSPVLSRGYAERARLLRQADPGGSEIRWVNVAGTGHAMLVHWRTWNSLVVDFVTAMVALSSRDRLR